MQGFRVYDMSDNKRLYLVIAQDEYDAAGIVENIAQSKLKQLVVCDIHDIPLYLNKAA